MTLPRFPNDAGVIAQDAARTKHLTVEQRLEQMFALVKAMHSLMSDNAREMNRKAQERSRRMWRQAHKEVYARHGI